MVATVLVLLSTQPLAAGPLAGNAWVMPVATLSKLQATAVCTVHGMNLEQWQKQCSDQIGLGFLRSIGLGRAFERVLNQQREVSRSRVSAAHCSAYCSQ